MLPEFAHFALVLALCLLALNLALSYKNLNTQDKIFLSLPNRISVAVMAMVAIAMVVLFYAFVSSDFSVKYVANNSTFATPVIYKLTALWGAHEGSLLLWLFILTIFTFGFSYFSNSLHKSDKAITISVLLAIAFGFLLFLLFTSNPFARYLPLHPQDGSELNPLLQDPLLAIHPPMLYSGYVGTAIPFALAICLLLKRKYDLSILKLMAYTTTIAWCFLSFGIMLGSFWAYYELGWGGFWFWDPVENASFVPWLCATALMHSLALAIKRRITVNVSIILAIITFGFSLIGTFLVRSGVLTSVHAFATDPARGVFILSFLVIVIGGALVLFAFRALKVPTKIKFSFFSRETYLLVNNLLLIVAAASIFLGTIYPLIIDALNLGKLSVGAPFFNLVFIPITLVMVMFMTLSIKSKWGQVEFNDELKLFVSFVIATLCAIAIYLLKIKNILTITAILLALWLIFATLHEVLQKRKAITSSFLAMNLAHFGFVVSLLGIALSQTLSIDKDFNLKVNDRVSVAGYDFKLENYEITKGANYQTTEVIFNIYHNNKFITSLKPEKRVYDSSRQALTDSAIDSNLLRDIYLAVAEVLPDKSFTVRIYYKPFIRFIWLGVIIMLIGGLIIVVSRLSVVNQDK